MSTSEPVGTLLRRWRHRRHRSQLDVSTAAHLSSRHLSFIETGRATPSRRMIERLCDELDVPLRDRNTLYLAAGLAPVHTHRPFADLGAARTAVRAVLTGHEPHPALAVDVRWDLLAANDAMRTFLRHVPPDLRTPPVNVLRATLHPAGLSRQVRNLPQWRALLLRRVRRQLDRTGDEGLARLLAELTAYPVPDGTPTDRDADVSDDGDELVVPLRLRTDGGDLALLYTTTVFGAPRDVTLDEIAIETFFPADRATAEVLRALSEAGTPDRAGAERTGLSRQ